MPLNNNTFAAGEIAGAAQITPKRIALINQRGPVIKGAPVPAAQVWLEDHFGTIGSSGDNAWIVEATGTYALEADSTRKAFAVGTTVKRGGVASQNSTVTNGKLSKSGTCSATLDAFYTFGLTQNLRGKHMWLDCYIEDASELQDIGVLWYKGTGTTHIGNTILSRIGATTRWGSGYVSFPLAALTTSAASGNAMTDWEAVKRIRIRFGTDAADKALDVKLIRIRFVNPLNAAKRPIVMRFDGGYFPQDEVLTYLTSKGLRAVVDVCPDTINSNDTAYMTMAQLLIHQANGHIITCHDPASSTLTTATGWQNTLTDAYKLDLVGSCQQWLTDNGLTSGLGLHYTLGGYHKPNHDFELMAPYLYHIGITNYNNCIPGCATRLGNRYDTENFTGDEATRRAAAVAAIQADIDGGLYCCALHHMAASSIVAGFNVADAKYIADWVVANATLECVTPEELIAGETVGRWYA